MFTIRVVHGAIASIEKGQVLSASFKEILFYSSNDGEMIEVGEETGNYQKCF